MLFLFNWVKCLLTWCYLFPHQTWGLWGLCVYVGGRTDRQSQYLYLQQWLEDRQVEGETALLDVTGSYWTSGTRYLTSKEKPVRTLITSPPEGKVRIQSYSVRQDLSFLKRCETLRYRSLQVKSMMCPRSVLASPLQQVGFARRSCWETE